MRAATPAPPGDAPPRDAPLHWRQGLLALLPLAFAGFMPFGTCLGLCAVTLLGLRFPAWGAERLLLFLLVIALGALLQWPGAWNAGIGALVGLGSAYLLHLGAVVLLNLALTLLGEGRRRGLLLVLLPGLLAPQWGLVPALLGGLLGREGPDDRLASRRAPPHRPAWGTVAGAAATLTLLGTLLPQAQLQVGQVPPQQVPPQQVAPAAADEERAGQVPEPPGLERQPAPAVAAPLVVKVDESRLSLPPFELLVLLSLLLLLVLGSLVWRSSQGPQRPPLTLLEKLMVAGLVLSFAFTLVSALLMQRGGRSAALPDPPKTLGEESAGLRELLPEPAARSVEGTGFVNAFGWGTAALLALAAALLFITMRRFGPRRVLSGSLPPGPQTVPAAPAPALHRVRLAYRRAEAALHAAGHARTPAETPAGYAARLGERLPELLAPLQTLTRAYEPVRYGGRVTAEDADSAEAAAERITELAPLLPSPDQAPDPRGL